MRRLKCAEVWGGIKNEQLDVCSGGLTVSLFSSACDGGKKGDVYFCSVCRGDRVTRVIIADVVGHGAAVSEIGVWVHDNLVQRMDDPVLANILTDLNSRLVARGLQAMTTAVALSFDGAERRLDYGYAGHPPILIRRNRVWTELPQPAGDGRKNLPFGVDRTCRYETVGVSLPPHTMLLLFTDGVIEAPSDSAARFGMNRLRAALAEIDGQDPMVLRNGIVERLRDWTGGQFEHDDVTFMAIQVDGHGASHAS